MKPFDYVMALVSIIIGLGITHVLSALGAAVHRLRGAGPPIRIEAVYLLWVGFVLFYMASFWWWEFQFNALNVRWSYGLYLFLVIYAVVLFFMVVVLVPSDMEGVVDSYAYFMRGRRWFLGVVIGTQLVDLVDSALKSVGHALDALYLAQEAMLVLACVVGMRSERRAVQLAVAVFAFALQMLYVSQVFGSIGN